MDQLPRTVPVKDLLTLRLTCNVCHATIEAEPTFLHAIYNGNEAFQCCPTCSYQAKSRTTPRTGFAVTLKKLAEVLAEMKKAADEFPDLQIEWILPESIRSAGHGKEKP